MPYAGTGVDDSSQDAYRKFYEIHDVPWTIPELNEQRKNWEYTDNGMRPHQAWVIKPPLQFLKDNGIMHESQSLYLSHI